MSIHKIEYGEGCYGPIVSIDGESLHLDEYDTRTADAVDKLKLEVMSELSKIHAALDQQDWLAILEIITSRGAWKVNEAVQKEPSTCEQCGNYNWMHTFNKSEE